MWHLLKKILTHEKTINIARILVSVVLIGYIFYLIPFSDRVTLKNGLTIDGSVQKWSEQSDTLVIKTERKTRTIDLNRIKFTDQKPYKPGLYQTFHNMNWYLFLPFFFLMPINYIITAFRWKCFLDDEHIKISTLKTLRLNWIGLFWNNVSLGMTGGDLVKGYLISKDLSQKSGAILSILLDRLTGLFGMATFALIASLFQLNNPKIRTLCFSLFAILGGGFLVFYVLFHHRFRSLAPVQWIKNQLPFQDIMQSLDRAFRRMIKRKQTLLVTFILSLFCRFLSLIMCYFYGQALNITSAGFMDYVLFYPIATMISSIPISAMGWGIGEMSYVYLFGLVGVPAASALSLSLLMRLSLMFWSLPGGIWMMFPSGESHFVQNPKLENTSSPSK